LLECSPTEAETELSALSLLRIWPFLPRSRREEETRDLAQALELLGLDRRTGIGEYFGLTRGRDVDGYYTSITPPFCIIVSIREARLAAGLDNGGFP